jgi:hypothetical protein
MAYFRRLLVFSLLAKLSLPQAHAAVQEQSLQLNATILQVVMDKEKPYTMHKGIKFWH